MKRDILILAAAILAVACSSNAPINRTDDLQKIINQELFIPTDDIAWRYGTTDTTITLSPNRYKIVAYFDDSGCSPCRLKELFCWNPIIREAQQRCLPLDFIFIVRADTANHEISRSLAITQVMAPVMFDPLGRFEYLNLLPQANSLHYFMLNPYNHITMLGNPAYNPGLWSKLKIRIHERLDF